MNRQNSVPVIVNAESIRKPLKAHTTIGTKGIQERQGFRFSKQNTLSSLKKVENLFLPQRISLSPKSSPKSKMNLADLFSAKMKLKMNRFFESSFYKLPNKTILKEVNSYGNLYSKFDRKNIKPCYTKIDKFTPANYLLTIDKIIHECNSARNLNRKWQIPL